MGEVVNEDANRDTEIALDTAPTELARVLLTFEQYVAWILATENERRAS